VIAPLVVTGSAFALVYCLLATPIYRATCRFEVFENEMLRISDTSMAPPRSRSLQQPRSSIQRQVVLLESNNLNNRVYNRLKEKWAASTGGRPPPEPKLRVTPVPEVEDVMLDIAVDSFDRTYGIEYLELLIREYEGIRRDEMLALRQDTLLNLQAERDKLAGEVDAALKAVTEFEAKHNLLFAQKKSASDLEHLADILQKSRAIRTQRTILESQFPFLAQANAATLQDVMDLTMFSTAAVREGPAGGPGTPGWSDLSEWRNKESRLTALRDEYTYLRKLYKPAHPRGTSTPASRPTWRRRRRCSKRT
jgi:uncharacterized protein involved in exopolysaccharide biosynthesis